MRKSNIFWTSIFLIIFGVLLYKNPLLSDILFDILKLYIQIVFVILFVLIIGIIIILNITPFILEEQFDGSDKYLKSFLYDKSYMIYKIRWLSLTYWLIILPYRKYIVPFNNWLDK